LHYFVTGAAGFIGSNLCDRLLVLGHQLTGFDNYCTGQAGFIAQAVAHPSFKMVRADLHEQREELTRAMAGAEFVFHLAANADVRFGTSFPRRDLEQEHDRDVECARSDAHQRHQAHRVFLHRFDLR